MTTAVIGCDDGLHHDRFNLQESEWDGLLYIRSADAVLPYGITIFPYTFHYDATGFLCYVYNEIDGSSTPLGLYDGLVPVVYLPPSLVKSTEIERDTVYRAVCRENTGIDLTVHCRGDDGDQFFFPYEYTTDVRSTSRSPPRRQCELVAVLARAHSDGDWRTFRRWINRRSHPTSHPLQPRELSKEAMMAAVARRSGRAPDVMQSVAAGPEPVLMPGAPDMELRYCSTSRAQELLGLAHPSRQWSKTGKAETVAKAR